MCAHGSNYKAYKGLGFYILYNVIREFCHWAHVTHTEQWLLIRRRRRARCVAFDSLPGLIILFIIKSHNGALARHKQTPRATAKWIIIILIIMALLLCCCFVGCVCRALNCRKIIAHYALDAIRGKLLWNYYNKRKLNLYTMYKHTRIEIIIIISIVLLYYL